MNDSVVRIGIVKGEAHWHKHDYDEFILVIRGKLYIELESRTIQMRHYQGITIPKTVMHRPWALNKVVMLRIESIGNKLTTGDDENWIDQINQSNNIKYPSGISQNTSIKDLQKFEGISTRSVNACYSVNLTTLKQLLEFHKNKRNNFAMIRNCGLRTDKELVDVCEKYKDYNFPEDTP